MSQANSHRIRPSKQAFTLIELLVVISIIALLISILLPALRAARTSAQLMQAGSQARQLHIAIFAYANDYNDILPPAAHTDPGDADGDGEELEDFWSQLLVRGKYINVDRPAAEGPPEIFFSPAHVRAPTTYHKKRWDTTGFGATMWSAMAQTNRGNLSAGGEVAPPMRQHDIRGPGAAKVIVLADTSYADLYYDEQGDGWYAVRELFTYNGNVARSYLDGHVSTGDSEQVHWIATSQRTGNWDLGGKSPTNYSGEPWYGRYRWDDPWE